MEGVQRGKEKNPNKFTERSLLDFFQVFHLIVWEMNAEIAICLQLAVVGWECQWGWEWIQCLCRWLQRHDKNVFCHSSESHSVRWSVAASVLHCVRVQPDDSTYLTTPCYLWWSSVSIALKQFIEQPCYLFFCPNRYSLGPDLNSELGEYALEQPVEE